MNPSDKIAMYEAAAEAISRGERLPPLPDSSGPLRVGELETDGYTANQMREYAAMAVRMSHTWPVLKADAREKGEAVAWRSALASCLRLLDIPGVANAAAGYGLVQARHDARQALATQPAHASEADIRDAKRYRMIRLGLSDFHGDCYAMTFAPDGDYPVDAEELDKLADKMLRRHATSSQETASE